MPAVRGRSTTRHRDRRSNDSNYEKRVEEALELLSTREYRSFRDAAKATGVRAQLVISKHL
jgi:hypothetical protein